VGILLDSSVHPSVWCFPSSIRYQVSSPWDSLRPSATTFVAGLLGREPCTQECGLLVCKSYGSGELVNPCVEGLGVIDKRAAATDVKSHLLCACGARWATAGGDLAGW